MITPILTFPGGCKVWSERTGELLYERGDEPLRVFRGRLVPVRDRAVLYALFKARWIRKQLVTMPELTASQRALGARVKRDLSTLRGPDHEKVSRLRPSAVTPSSG